MDFDDYHPALAPQEEAKLIALAQSKGLSADALIGEVMGRLSSAEEINQNRAEMFANLRATNPRA